MRKQPHAEYLARLQHADLFLDTEPYNAHTTASDALWAGCPVLTRPGETFAARVAGSLNHHLRHDRDERRATTRRSWRAPSNWGATRRRWPALRSELAQRGATAGCSTWPASRAISPRGHGDVAAGVGRAAAGTRWRRLDPRYTAPHDCRTRFHPAAPVRADRVGLAHAGRRQLRRLPRRTRSPKPATPRRTRAAADDRYQLRAKVSQWIADDGVDGMLVTGGTGFTGRDSTPEALLPLLDKEMPGFGELFRAISFDEIGTSTLQSRAFAGLANGTFVFALPGSTSACRTAWEKIIRAQLDARTRPCNLATLRPRLKE